MTRDELPVSPRSIDEPIDDTRYQEGQKVTWVSVGVNLLLTAAQIAGGLLTNAQSLVADGFHSLSDLVADFLVLVANYHSRHPADDDHPYGHHRIETAASLGLGLLLVAAGGAILWGAAGRVQHIDSLPPVSMAALWIALATLAAKEGLFRYMLHVGEKLRSPMLIANAWHARSDAASSLVVAVGIGASLLGYPVFDPIAALIVGVMILRMGAVFSWDALRELMDEGLTNEEVAAIRAVMRETPGVIGLHELRTRRMAQKSLIDAHVQVEAHISVSEGHRIAEEVRKRVLSTHPDVIDILVHIDPVDDQAAADAMAVPLRAELTEYIRRMVDEIMGPAVVPIERVQLHYLGKRAEAEVFVGTAFALKAEHVRQLEQALLARLPTDPYLEQISLNTTIAPR